ncbi:uncharacterized protein LOC136086604 [Hydra vulgaris]|uniref:Uncharacterized protein LOC136086604 n=1 Tax=Hydra vulgaris TaxID=6087 RepID=A0ABM4CSL4_HYDVU
MKGINGKKTEKKIRSLEDLYSDYERFTKSGGVKSNAKSFNNAITEPIFKIPLEQTVRYKSLMHENSLKKGKGLCTKLIETFMQSLKVQRQAYHGKSFVGNHVHKMPKKSSILKLCNSIPKFVYNQALMYINGQLILAQNIRNCLISLFNAIIYLLPKVL